MPDPAPAADSTTGSVDAGSASREPAAGGLRWLILSRALILALSGAVLALLSGRTFPPQRLGPVAFVIAVGIALDLIYLAISELLPRLPRQPFIVIQLAMDCALIVSMVYLTGGVHSVFIHLYFGPILAAALLLPPAYPLLYASLATFFQSVVSLGYYFSAATRRPLPLVDTLWLEQVIEDLNYTLGFLLAQAVAFALVGALGRRLSLRLSQTRILYDEILHNLADGVVTLDAAGRLVYVNEPAQRLLQLPEPPPVGQRLAGPLHVPLAPLLQGTPARVEIVLEDGDQSRPTGLSTSLIPDQRGRTRGVIGILSDLSTHRRMEDALQRAQRMQALGELAAGIAHELRNPLASIRGCIQELVRDPAAAASDDGREMMEIVISESDRLNEIITEFLQFTRMPRARFRPVELTPLLDEVALLLRQQADDPAQITVHAEPDLSLRADAGQLRQMLLNLGLNAMQAADGPGPVELRATAEVRDNAGTPVDGGPPRPLPGVLLEVVDQGRGIPDADRERLFDPFFTTRPEGTGLGLAIVSRIAESHRAAIDLDSRPGKGTRIGLWLPCDPEQLEGPPALGTEDEHPGSGLHWAL